MNYREKALLLHLYFKLQTLINSPLKIDIFTHPHLLDVCG